MNLITIYPVHPVILSDFYRSLYFRNQVLSFPFERNHFICNFDTQNLGHISMMKKPETMSQKNRLLGRSVSQILELLQPLGEPEYRARQIYKWIHHHNVDHFQEMSNIPKSLRSILSDHFQLKTLQLAQKTEALDRTEKYLWKLADHRMVESVLI